jgi:hypothetical protein
MHITLGRRMNILITRSFDPLAEQLDENKGYRRHKSEMFVSQAICVDAWRQN